MLGKKVGHKTETHPLVPVRYAHRENQVLEAASRALASFIDLAKAAAVSAPWNYFVSECAIEWMKTAAFQFPFENGVGPPS